MITAKQIERVFRVIDRSLFHIDGTLDYDRIIDATMLLANLVHEYAGNTDDIWYIGEFGACYLAEYLPGAYWHLTEWHRGQSSKEYAAMCAIGQVFNPGMSTLERDGGEYEAYSALAAMAQS